MEKINFQNNTAPYINDVNLNQMQDNIENAINETYSLQEVKTNKKWIDNKPIYRKAVTFSNSTAQEYLSIDMGISNIDKIIKLETIAERNNQIRNIPYIQSISSTNWLGGCYINKTVGELIIFAGEQLILIDDGIAIIEYTKTTD